MSERRERILDGIVRVLVRDGVDRLRIRTVADEADVSVGAVQHFFATRNDMVHAAMDHVSSAVTARLLGVLETSGGTPRERLRDACLVLASVEDDERPWSVVWLAFTSLACTDATLAEAHQAAWQKVETGLRVLLERAAPGSDADDAAELLAVLDGISVARATEPERMPRDRAETLIRRVVARMCRDTESDLG